MVIEYLYIYSNLRGKAEKGKLKRKEQKTLKKLHEWYINDKVLWGEA